jgi:magnesium-transporting ATPase (P-type)
MLLKLLFHGSNDFHPFFSIETVREISSILITGVSVLIVSVPEGLPLAISIAMALSVGRLKKDNILLKNLEAV